MYSFTAYRITFCTTRVPKTMYCVSTIFRYPWFSTSCKNNGTTVFGKIFSKYLGKPHAAWRILITTIVSCFPIKTDKITNNWKSSRGLWITSWCFFVNRRDWSLPSVFTCSTSVQVTRFEARLSPWQPYLTSL